MPPVTPASLGTQEWKLGVAGKLKGEGGWLAEISQEVIREVNAS